METKRKVLPPAHVKKRPTETPYSAYKKEVNRLLTKAQNGGGWSVKFFVNRKLGENVTAECRYHLMGRWVAFHFNPLEVKDVAEAKNAAKHEFGHFVTGRLERLAMWRHTTEAEILEELEHIARIFERLV